MEESPKIPNDQLDSLVAPIALYPDPLLQGEETVGADTLDNICRQHGISSAQFIKMDVQGAEAKVLRGAIGLLRASHECILMTEFWPYGLARCGADGLEYLDMLMEIQPDTPEAIELKQRVEKQLDAGAEAETNFEMLYGIGDDPLPTLTPLASMLYTLVPKGHARRGSAIE